MRRAASTLIALAACTSHAPLRDPPSATLELLTGDAEVWALEATLRGQVRGDARLVACTLHEGTASYPTSLAHGAFRGTLPLRPGAVHEVEARCRERGGRTLTSERVRLTSMLPAAPLARPEARGEGDTLVLDATKSEPHPLTHAPLRSYTWLVRDAHHRERALGTDARLVLPRPAAGRHTYVLRVRDESGAEDVARIAIDVAPDGSVHTPVDPADWLDRAIVYGVAPSVYGAPPLARVTEQLGSLRDLGVTTLWLSPVYATRAGDFGYAVTDPLAVRADFGSERELATLVSEAHARDLRVLLDLVVNHTSDQHRYFVEAEARGARSHYFDFYARDAAGRPQHYFDWTHLPNLAYAQPEVRAYVSAFSSHWVRTLGIDGYRVDAAWGVRQRAPDFFPGMQRALRRIEPELALIAEASARDPYYLTHGFDAAYDWTDALGQHAWTGVFDDERGIAGRLAAALDESMKRAERPERTLRFLNNNDTGARFITRHGERLTHVATAALLTLPGIPCLYTFDERGAEFEPYDPDKAKRLDERPALWALHHALIKLRRRLPALRGPGYEPLARGEGDELLAFVRRTRRGDERALVVLNFGARPIHRTLTLPRDLGPSLRDALSGAPAPLRGGALALALEPWGMRIFVPDRR